MTPPDNPLNDDDNLDGVDTGSDEATANENDDLEPETGTTSRARGRERASDKVARIAAERLKQAQEMAVEFRHLRDCPEEGALPGDGERRVEHFPATRPRTETDPPQFLLVIHCMECGESEVAPDESERA